MIENLMTFIGGLASGLLACKLVFKSKKQSNKASSFFSSNNKNEQSNLNNEK